MMQKIGMYLIVIMLVGVIFLGGCVEVNSPQDANPFYITQFKVDPSVITLGDTANLSWIVMGGKSVSIDNGIGSVSLTGTRVVAPTETTTYTLIAANESASLTATTQVIVNEPTEPTDSDIVTSMSMNIFSKDTSIGEIIWLVTSIEGGPIEEDSLTVVLLKQDYSIDADASITYSDIDYNDYVNPGDTFAVVASEDGYYVLRISDKSSGDILFESSSIHYEKISSTLSMNTFSFDDSANQRIWLVSGTEGSPVADDSYLWALLKDDGSNASGATCVFNEVTGAGYVNAGDTFSVTAPADGYYVLLLTNRYSGSSIYKSATAKY